MGSYLATFHTHYGAMRFRKCCRAQGLRCAMEPVPRVLSASCGVCVRFSSEVPLENSGSEDLDSIFEALGEMEYKLLFAAE